MNGVEKPDGEVYTPFLLTTSYQREKEGEREKKKKTSHATPFHVSLSNSQGLFVILFNNEYYDGLVFHFLKNLTHKCVIANNLKCV